MQFAFLGVRGRAPHPQERHGAAAALTGAPGHLSGAPRPGCDEGPYGTGVPPALMDFDGGRRAPPRATYALARAKWGGPAPFAPRALPRFTATMKQSAPSRRIGTFGLAV